VTVTLFDSNGEEIATHEQPFLWHPWLYHHGRTWRIPGKCRVRVASQRFLEWAHLGSNQSER
jgi:hypothetical protein